MPNSRRGFLKAAGSAGAALVILAAGGGTFVLTRSPTKALAPWKAAGSGYRDARLRALSYAILSPNPHNRQPWLVDLRTPEELTLYCDLERLLPDTDPYNRQIVIGLGCFLELLRMAAANDGLVVEIEEFPSGGAADQLDARPIARVRFSKDDKVSRDPLFHHVLERRSNKEPYDTSKPVGSGVLTGLAAVAEGVVEVGTTNQPAQVDELRDLTNRAFEIEIKTPRTYDESIQLMRIGKAEIEANPDGIDIGGVFPEAMKVTGLLTRESLADPGSVAFAQTLEMYRGITGSAMAYVWVTTNGNGRLDQLAAGRAWLRLNLKAAELGLGIHPLSQALQEYAEMAVPYQEVHDKLGVAEPKRIQMLGRLGYGPDVEPSPKWPLETRIRNS